MFNTNKELNIDSPPVLYTEGLFLLLAGYGMIMFLTHILFEPFMQEKMWLP